MSLMAEYVLKYFKKNSYYHLDLLVLAITSSYVSVYHPDLG
jgi:hypothetical protein